MAELETCGCKRWAIPVSFTLQREVTLLARASQLHHKGDLCWTKPVSFTTEGDLCGQSPSASPLG